jgi:hypothetical protein
VAIDSRAISPELVLVDPDLARVERARLVEPRATFTRPLLLPPTLTAPAPADQVPEAPAAIGPREPLMLAILLVSLGVNGWLVSRTLSDNRPATAPAPPATVTAAVDATPPVARVTPPVRGNRIAAAERSVLLWVLRAPRGTLPAGLIDPRTHLALKTVGVTCRAARAPRSYRCELRARGHRRVHVLSVRYPAPAEGGALVKLLH